jgi:hypothetical protein
VPIIVAISEHFFSNPELPVMIPISRRPIFSEAICCKGEVWGTIDAEEGVVFCHELVVIIDLVYHSRNVDILQVEHHPFGEDF